ncbi:MAG: hypothetical protein HUK04_04085 [Bacteroidaceae bacterium]|nr:hypothetical protein [Bacteroidaceae bacterium]MCF0188652.1 hypothetical protein [Bacteroidaceae bacterium]
MKLLLKRIARKNAYTIGRLYVNGKYVCDTLEDTDRGLSQGMTLKEVLCKKIMGKTAIPTGTYRVAMDIPSPRYSNFRRYPWAQRYDGMLPRLCDVLGYQGVLVHVGNRPEDTEGCILVGRNKVVGQVVDSQATFHELMKILRASNEAITITIE